MSNSDNDHVNELDPEPSPGHADQNLESDQDSDLEHYLVGPDGVYLEDQGISDSDNDLVEELDPKPSSGPVDPG